MENYNKMYHNEITETVTQNSIWEEPAKVEEDEIPEVFVTGLETVESKPVYGLVVNCDRLNVREAPNIDADVVCVIKALTEVEIDESESTDEFYKIYLSSGLEGYCMRKFIVEIKD